MLWSSRMKSHPIFEGGWGVWYGELGNRCAVNALIAHDVGQVTVQVDFGSIEKICGVFWVWAHAYTHHAGPDPIACCHSLCLTKWHIKRAGERERERDLDLRFLAQQSTLQCMYCRSFRLLHTTFQLFISLGALYYCNCQRASLFLHYK